MGIDKSVQKHNSVYVPQCQPRAVIIGMMGAGKTRVGKEIAHTMQLPFIDADVAIEHELGMPITQYFAEYGEPAFRAVEADMIERILGEHQGIFSLGGGAPMTPRVQNMLAQYKAHGGRVIYLMAEPHEAMERARRGGGRPLLAGDDAEQRWMALYEQRDPVFHRIANVLVSTHGLTPALAAKKVRYMIEQHVVHVSSAQAEPYDVHIGAGVLNQLEHVFKPNVVRVALIHTQPVQRHADRVRTLLRHSGYQVTELIVPDAEAGKTVQVADHLWRRLGEDGFTRSDAIVGVGGGAATDLAGFIAATWMRGITYVNCPTSLLAMVDASTGGKTGINTDAGKNLVGSFYTPAAVLADISTLATLPNDIFVEGLGEVAKSGFIMDQEIIRILQTYAPQLRHWDPATSLDSLEPVIAELIERTVRVKVHHVNADFKEQGLREFLNYGHTLAHAIEKIEHFSWRHGNAVAVGMVYAAELAYLLGMIDRDMVDLHRELLTSLGLPVAWKHDNFDDVLALMHKDKKARGNALRFVLLSDLGKLEHVENPPADAVEQAFHAIQME